MITSAYIHIPFCKTICSYCDFPKFCYMKKWIKPYLEALKEEIKQIYQNEKMKTIYIGGGTPTSLSDEELENLLKIIILLKREESCEFTIEANAEDITEEKVKIMKKYGVNRISIGVQTFDINLKKKLNRMSSYEDIKKAVDLLKKEGIENINLDIMYAIPGETMDTLKSDLKKILSLDIPHISTYSLILEEHTKLYLDNPKLIDQDLDYEMYENILKALKEKEYIHYEISNFSKKGYESNHNLTYWNNEQYYGFGLGASSYIKNKRMTNHMNLTKYLEKNFSKEEEKVTEKEKMEYEMILGLRKIEGVSDKQFYKKYERHIEEIFDIKKLLKEGLLYWENEYLKISENNLYLSNEILVNFLIS